MFRLPVLGGTSALRLLLAIIAISITTLIPRAAGAATEADASAYSEPTLRDAPIIELAPDAPELLVADQALQAAEAQDWTRLVIALCILVSWALRRFTSPLGWPHTTGGMLGIAAASALLSALGHGLSRPHWTFTGVGVSALVAAALALVAASNPTTMAIRARAATNPALALLALVVGLSACGSAQLPVALERAERDALACAAPVVQAEMQRIGPAVIDALAGNDVNWEEQLTALEVNAGTAAICAVAHLVFDAIGVASERASVAGLERLVQQRQLLAQAGQQPLPSATHRQVMNRGARWLHQHMAARRAPR